MAFASFTRSIGYLRQLGWRRNHIYVEKTGAEIKITRNFLFSVWSIFRLYCYLVAVSLGNYLRQRVNGSTNTRTIAFFPDQPAPWYTIWGTTQLSGMRIISRPQEADVVFVFEDKTYTVAGSRLPHIDGKLVNAECANVAKHAVADHFKQTFGYPIEIDPLTYTGKAVCKSNINGTHDGRVVQCPVAPEDMAPGNVYQRLVNNSKDGITVQDYRVIVVGEKIAVSYIKHRDIARRFENDNCRADLVQPDDLFTPEEQRCILALAKSMRLDFGGIDVLRDQDDGHLYIVDVNKTCMTPPVALAFPEKVIAMKRLAIAFSDFTTT